MRLDKFLAEAGLGTRSEVKKQIKKKQVQVNGTLATDPGMAVAEDSDVVTVNGQQVKPEGILWYLLHKPAGYVTANSDDRFPTVMELIPSGRGLFPVGRLDKDTEGLLLVTNDGARAHQLLSPRQHVAKTYLALLDVPTVEEDKAAFAQGVDIGDDKPTLPAELVLPAYEEMAAYLGSHAYLQAVENQRLIDSAYAPENCLALLTITEGRYHQVKRMFLAVGKEVIYLKRLSFAELELPLDLPAGQCVVLEVFP